MPEIMISKGHVTIVDTEDYPLLSKYRWFALPRGRTYYAYGHVGRESGKVISAFVHRLILNAPVGIQVDHINGDGLDNRRANLRLCTIAGNQHNRHTAWGASKYKGVTWHKQKGKWQAQIQSNYKNIFLGLFDDEVAAARAYDVAALNLFGEFARSNESIGMFQVPPEGV